MHRAADGERTAGRDGGQFRQGHSYRHGRSLSFDGVRLTDPKWPARLHPFASTTGQIGATAIGL